MTAPATRTKKSRIVLVVGLDLAETSEHLLGTVGELTHGVQEAELHVVHVVPPQTMKERMGEPVTSRGLAEGRRTQVAQWELERLCQAVVSGASVDIVVHTPAGRPVTELARLARRVGADAIIVEAHEHHSGARRFFHRSVAAGLARSASCSVLTVRAHHPAATPDGGRPG
jgi:nucleotide-binding universal stress UspA family protein